VNPAYLLEQPRKRMREKGREGEKGWRRGGRKGEGLGGEKEGGREGGGSKEQRLVTQRQSEYNLEHRVNTYQPVLTCFRYIVSPVDNIGTLYC